jgi:copper(I)-binding protein
MVDKKTSMRPFVLLVVLGVLVSAGRGFADDAPIRVEKAWIQAVPPVSDITAAYMKITNLGSVPVRISGASSNAAGAVELMTTTREERDGKEILGMESVNEFVVPAGGSLQLKPGGDHLMLMGLKSHPKEGAFVKMTLKFGPGDQALDIQIEVRKEEPK